MRHVAAQGCLPRLAGWGLLSTISSWLEDTAASQRGMTRVMSSSALSDRDVIFLGVNSLEMLVGQK